MTKKIYRCGDVVQFTRGYKNGNPIMWYCILQNIAENTLFGNKYYDEYIPISGAMVEFLLKPIGQLVCRGNKIERIEEIKENEFWTSEFNISILNVEDECSEIEKNINNSHYNIEFLKKNQNRKDKLEKLLE